MSKARIQTPMMEWKDLPWRKLERRVFKLQKRIFRASERGDVKAVRRLQKTLMRSWSAKCLAVRRVTQDNQGKKTAGVDGVKELLPTQRLELTQNLRLSHKTKPTRRVWIPKPGKTEKRPLGIPTITDRALQALVKQAIEPEWEAKFEPNSYGFRPGRSCHDAIEAIFEAIKFKPKYVLDADIAQCFDRINQAALLEKLNTSPTIRRQIRAWLKAGVMDGNKLFPTSEGTPQGGVISPLLANVALHGIEERIKQEFPRYTKLGKETWFHKKGDDFNSPNLIRYADDFVVLHENLAVVQRCQQIIVEWLTDMSLELKESKTQIAHTLNEHKGKIGFNFLGFHIRQYPVGKYKTGRCNGTPLGFKTLIKPNDEKIKLHTKRIGDIVQAHRSAHQKTLIKSLNPIIRGWANYFSTVCSGKIFSHLDHNLFKQLKAWCNYRHPKKPLNWIARKYWHTHGGDNYSFQSKEEDEWLRLLKHGEVSIKRHIKVQKNRSPYDGDWVYWGTRLGRNPKLKSREAHLLKQQKGKCAHCGLFFKIGDLLETDHITPKTFGGKDTKKNWQLLHRHCHDEKTLHDRSNDKVCMTNT